MAFRAPGGGGAVAASSVTFTPAGNISATDVQAAIEELDDEKVGLAGDETVAGIKTFSSSPIVPAPTTDLQASTKKYVDDNAGGDPLAIYSNCYNFEALGSDSTTGTPYLLTGGGTNIRSFGGYYKIATSSSINTEKKLSWGGLDSSLNESAKALTIEFNIKNFGSDAAQDIRLMFTNSTATPPLLTADGFGFKIVDADISATSGDGTTEEATDTAVNVTTGEQITRLKIVFTAGTDAKFYIDDVLKATHTTNLPAAGDSLLLSQYIKNTAEANKEIQIRRVAITKAY